VGAGAFLDAALDLHGPGLGVYGTDCDPMAVASTRLMLATRHGIDPDLLAERIVLADTLALATAGMFDAPWRARWPDRFDLVAGNPPFGNGIEGRTRRSLGEASALRSAFPEIARGPFDISVPFVRIAAGSLAGHGMLAMLLPRALLAARYAEGLRAWMLACCPPLGLVRYEGDRACPDAQIAMVGLIAGRLSVSSVPPRAASPSTSLAVERPVQPTCISMAEPVRVSSTPRVETWGSLLDPFYIRIDASARPHPRIGDFFEVRSGAAVAEAYRMALEIVEEGDAPGWRFLTAGAIERYTDLWGVRRTRHLGRTFHRPVLPFGAPSLTASRAALYGQPKILVSGLSRVLEATMDEDGSCAGGVGTLLVTDRADRGPRVLRRLLLLLNSAWCSMLHRAWRGPLSLAGGNLPATRRDLAELPFPGAALLDEESPLDHLDPRADDLAIQKEILALGGAAGMETRLLDAWMDQAGRKIPRPAVNSAATIASCTPSIEMFNLPSARRGGRKTPRAT
jgi:hypothetical protein